MYQAVCRCLLIATLLASFAAPCFAGNPASAARYFEDALARFNDGDHDGAVIQLKNALQEDRSMLAAHVLLGRALLHQGQYSAAEVAFRDARSMGVDIGEIALPYGRLMLALGRAKELLETVPEQGLPRMVAVQALSLRASALAQLGRIDDALATLARARESEPADAAPLVTQASILLDAGRREEALEAAIHALRLDPKDPTGWSTRASVRHARGQLAAAIEDYGKALELKSDFVDARVARAALYVDLGRDGEAVADLQTLRVDAPDDPRAAYLRSLVADRAGRSEQAHKELKSVQQLIGALPSEWLAQRPQYLMLGALANHALGAHSAASGLLGTLLKKQPRHFGARKLLASIQLDGGDAGRALDTVEPVLADTPNDPMALYLAGRAYLVRGRAERALRLLEQAAQSTSDPDVLKALGQSRIASGQVLPGTESIARSFDARPDDEGAGFLLATLYMRQNRKNEAFGVMDGLVARHPRSAAAWNMLGAVRASGGDLARARSAYGEAIRLAPAMLVPRLNLVRLDVAQGRLEEAAAALASLLRSHQRDANVLFELGQLELLRNRPEAARSALRKALDADPSSSRIALALGRLHQHNRRLGDALIVARDAAIRAPGDFRVLAFLAEMQLAAGEREGALQTYQDMTKLAEFDPQRQVQVGWLNLAAGDFVAAAYNLSKAETGRPDFRPAIELAGAIAVARKDWAGARLQLARLRAQADGALPALRLELEIARGQGEVKRELAVARRLFELQADGSSARSLADALLHSDRGVDAIAAIGLWLEQHPDDVPVRITQGELAIKFGNWPLALQAWKALAGRLPEHPGVLNNLALSHAGVGQYRQALEVARAAHGLAPQDPVVLDTLGWALVRNADVEGGLRYLRDARLRLPENAEVRWHLGFALAELGRSREARDELSQALGLSSEFHGAADAARLLARLRE